MKGSLVYSTMFTEIHEREREREREREIRDEKASSRFVINVRECEIGLESYNS